ncbi:MAG TPA: FlgD immunoglobulin-like domain containing protein, partial [Candidatus Cloacimonas sp.]|nr:FlgD immunoglobulin-like domain containing protein [Candidatus Cloacimonas sp.]
NDTLSYYVVALYGEVESEPTNSVTVIVSGVANSDETMIPVIGRVSVSPNPFSDLAVISYELGKDSVVELKLYNLKGQLVRTLHQGSQSKGFQTLAWEGCDDSGRHVASGIYILQLSLDGKAVKRVKLVKC